ncbi:pantetheine-phosphate adenylyltransferase [Gammaproteobacteria bacterium]
MTLAIYPGTFDPITNGHTDLVGRAARLFQQVVVAVAANTSKQTLFDLESRVKLARMALQGIPYTRVEPFTGLLADYVRHQGAGVILRGLRAVSDFEYEFQLAGMNRRLVPEAETLFLPTGEQFFYLSSSLVREIALLGGDISDFVHPEVLAALTSRRSHSQ